VVATGTPRLHAHNHATVRPLTRGRADHDSSAQSWRHARGSGPSWRNPASTPSDPVQRAPSSALHPALSPQSAADTPDAAANGPRGCRGGGGPRPARGPSAPTPSLPRAHRDATARVRASARQQGRPRCCPPGAADNGRRPQKAPRGRAPHVAVARAAEQSGARATAAAPTATSRGRARVRPRRLAPLPRPPTAGAGGRKVALTPRKIALWRAAGLGTRPSAAAGGVWPVWI